MCEMRHSQIAMYFATMSPRPAQSMRIGACARISESSRIPSGQWLYSETLTWLTSIEEEFEA